MLAMCDEIVCSRFDKSIFFRVWCCARRGILWVKNSDLFGSQGPPRDGCPSGCCSWRETWSRKVREKLLITRSCHESSGKSRKFAQIGPWFRASRIVRVRAFFVTNARPHPDNEMDGPLICTMDSKDGWTNGTNMTCLLPVSPGRKSLKEANTRPAEGGSLNGGNRCCQTEFCLHGGGAGMVRADFYARFGRR